MEAGIIAVSYHLPKKTLTNEDLAKEHPDWDFARITEKTGIFSRHVAAAGERASDFAVAAAGSLFADYGINKEDIDALMYCTQSPDYVLPTTACLIQDRLGLPTSIAAFDYNLGCSGYIYGLALASSMIRSGISRNVLLITAETYSKYILPDDRASRTLFGDGAAATLIAPVAGSSRIGPFVLGTDGDGAEKLIVREGHLFMDGAGIFMFTMKRIPECIRELLKKSGCAFTDIDCFIFHQASKVVIDTIVRMLSLDEKKVFRGYERIGNTVSVSLPIALKQSQEQALIKRGDLVMLVGFGVGLSWGACLVRL